MLSELEKIPINNEQVMSQAKFLLPGVKPRVYKRLLDRPCCGKIYLNYFVCLFAF